MSTLPELLVDEIDRSRGRLRREVFREFFAELLLSPIRMVTASRALAIYALLVLAGGSLIVWLSTGHGINLGAVFQKSTMLAAGVTCLLGIWILFVALAFRRLGGHLGGVQRLDIPKPDRFIAHLSDWPAGERG
jgi:hypothetical protein